MKVDYDALFWDAFISYGRADSKQFCIGLYQKLQEAGLKVWFDQNDIPPGVDYQKQINSGLEKSHNFLFIMSPHSVNSPYCRIELDLALQHRKRIIPIMHVCEVSEETWRRRKPSDKTELEWNDYYNWGWRFGDVRNPNLHPAIARINWLWMQEQMNDQKKAFQDLLNLIQDEDYRAYVEQHTVFLTKALEWEKHHKQTQYLLIGEERKQAEEWLRKRFYPPLQPPCTATDLHCEFISESIKNAHNLMAQVFLCYAIQDTDMVNKVRHCLMREGLTVWTQATDIRSGSEAKTAIEQGIVEADNIVCLVSANFLQSSSCQQEFQYAISLNKRVIPLLLAETDSLQLTDTLRDLQWLDLTSDTTEDGAKLHVSKLLKILHDDASYYETHKALLVKALKWKRQNQNQSILLRGHNLNHAKTWLELGRRRSHHPPLPLQIHFVEESQKQPPNETLDVFISYSRADSDFARKLNDELQFQGKTTWFDQESIDSGADFQQEIYRGIETCDNFLFIISPKSVNSPYCADEVEYAASLNKRFITILHRSVDTRKLHPDLAKLQWIDFDRHKRDFNTNFGELIRALETDRNYVHEHTKWSQRALRWQEKNKRTEFLLRGIEEAEAGLWLQQAEINRKEPQPTPLQREFIRASRELFNAEKRLKKLSFIGLVIVSILMSVLSLTTWRQWRRAEVVQEGQINALSGYSQALKESNRELNALVEAIRAARQAQQQRISAETRKTVLTTLQNALFEIHEKNQLVGHENTVYAVSFSPDGKLLATASADNSARIWTVEGEELAKLEGHTQLVTGIQFSPDGQLLATSSNDGTVKLWTLDGKEIRTWTHHASINGIAFDPSGQIVATAGGDRVVKLWNLDGQELSSLIGHTSAVYAVAFSGDGQLIATASDDSTARVWDRTGRVLQTLEGHDAKVRDVAWSPDNRTIATASDDQTIKLWNRDGQELRTLRGHTDFVLGVDFSPDGRSLVTASQDSTAKIWNIQGQELQTLYGHELPVSKAVFNPTGDTIVTASADNTVKLWHYEPLTLKALEAHHDTVEALSFSPDGELIATVGGDRQANLWSKDGSLLQTLQGHEDRVATVAFSPDSTLIATGSDDKTVKLWTRSGTELQTLRGFTYRITRVRFSPDGQTLAVSSGADAVTRWTIHGKHLGTITEPGEWVYDIDFSPDGQTLATATWQKQVRVWSVEGKALLTLQDDDPILGVCFSLDGQMIGIALDDTEAQIWSRDGTLLQTLTHDQPLTSISFSPNGRMLATGTTQGAIVLWTVEGLKLQTFQSTLERINSVSFSPDGTTLGAASNDSTAQLWQLDGERLARSEMLWRNDMEGLLLLGCQWVQGYLTYNAALLNSDRRLCNGL